MISIKKINFLYIEKNDKKWGKGNFKGVLFKLLLQLSLYIYKSVKSSSFNCS